MVRFAIRSENLSVRYLSRGGKFVQAVDGLTFSVEPGEVVGFLGPNGAGKSSTLKTLMGFVEPSGGECWVFEDKAGSLEAKTRIGYLPEVALYYPFLTPAETLALYGELQGLKGKELKNQVVDLLEQLGILEFARKQNRTLSKGQLQRVGIAQALLGQPELLVMDEVTSGLDPVGRKELRSLLLKRQQEGCTLFFSSHELSEVEMLCDRILILNHGKLLEERKMADLKRDLQKFTLRFSVRGLETNMEFASKEELLQEIERVSAMGGRILDVATAEGSLEDYFVQAIGRAA